MHRRFLIRAAAMVLGVMLLPGIGGGFAVNAAETASVTIFAAASTTNAITDISKLFAEKNKAKVTHSFASSSTLAKQIEQGAPADVFLSADQKWMNYLAEKQSIVPQSRFDLLGNKIVLIAPASSTLKITVGPKFDLAKVLGNDKLAMGDPDHVPAGIYGKQALEKLGVWKDVEAKVARAKDVRAALALVERGEAPLGVVYATDAAITKKVKVAGVFPENSHPPIVYPVALVKGKTTPTAKSYLEFLKSPAAKTVFEKYGFSVK
jgi:molybdate transport system substrate-binding protein